MYITYVQTYSKYKYVLEVCRLLLFICMYEYILVCMNIIFDLFSIAEIFAQIFIYFFIILLSPLHFCISFRYAESKKEKKSVAAAICAIFFVAFTFVAATLLTMLQHATYNTVLSTYNAARRVQSHVPHITYNCLHVACLHTRIYTVICIDFYVC